MSASNSRSPMTSSVKSKPLSPSLRRTASPTKSLSEDWSLIKMFEGLLPASISGKTSQDNNASTAEDSSLKNKRSRSVPNEHHGRSLRRTTSPKPKWEPHSSHIYYNTRNSQRSPTNRRTTSSVRSQRADWRSRSKTISASDDVQAGYGKSSIRRNPQNVERTSTRRSMKKSPSRSPSKSPKKVDEQFFASNWKSLKNRSTSPAAESSQIHFGLSNANFKSNFGYALEKVRGPFIRAPTGCSNEKLNDRQDSGDSSNSSLEGNLSRADESNRLSPFTSPCPSPMGITCKSPTLQISCVPGETNSDSQAQQPRLSPYQSPSTSPFLRRKRAQYRASSAGSATVASYGSVQSRGSLSGYSSCGYTGAISPSANQHLSPYSMSPSPSHPTSPTTPNHSSGLLSRRLSSCRPSLSSCSSSLFSNYSSKEASPDVQNIPLQQQQQQQHQQQQQQLTQGHTPYLLSPKSPNTSLSKPNSLNYSTNSNTVFVYPTSPNPRYEMGSINPELYKNSCEDSMTENDKGRLGEKCSVEFRLVYQEGSHILEVIIKRFVNVPPRFGDIFLKLGFESESHKQISATFKVQEGDAIEIDRSYSLQVQKNDVSCLALKMNLSGCEPGQLTLFPLGEICKPVESLLEAISNEKTLTEYFVTTSKEPPTENLARVKISLCYNGTLQRLTLAIYECMGLQVAFPEVNRCYMKIILNQSNSKNTKSKRTDILKLENSETTEFNQSFNFKLDETSLHNAEITLQFVEVTNILDRDKVLGSVLLGYSTSNEEHWKKMVHCSKDSILRWHNIVRT